MKIQELKPAEGSRHKPKRIGRGPGSGHGKTSTKGHKGQKARSGGTKGPGFEGGQMPIQRRLPKRGFRNMPFKKEYAIVNLRDLAMVEGTDMITPEVLLQRRIIKDIKDGVKVLGVGEVTRPLVVRAHAFSAAASERIGAAGGKAEVL